jgi:hypothetical protein
MHHSARLWRLEWIELGIFSLLAVITIILLLQFRSGYPRRSRAKNMAAQDVRSNAWITIPEVQLLTLALPLQLLWEIAQFPLYTVWHEGDWGYILYGLVHCTLGDLLILLCIFWLVALLNRNRRWYLDAILANGFLFTVLGVGYTIYSEIVNVRIKSTWGYTELMPIVPVIEIGGMPFLQWVFIPPILLVLMRYYSKALNGR